MGNVTPFRPGRDLLGGPGMGKVMPACSAEVAAWIEGYRPQHIEAAVWEPELRPFVVGALLEGRPSGLSAARLEALALSRLVVWCINRGIPLDVESVLDPDTVERFVTTAAIPDRSRAVYRSALRRLGPVVTRRAPWEPRPAVLRRRSVAAPYTAAELATLRWDAAHQSTEARRQAASALIALGAGAGLDGRWSLDVTAADVSGDGGVVVVGVGAPNPRRVTVLAEFEDELVELARPAGAGPLTGCVAIGRNRANSLARSIVTSTAAPSLSLPRLRSTWLLAHLDRGARLPELAAAAGLRGITVLSDLLADVAPLDPAAAARMLRGER